MNWFGNITLRASVYIPCPLKDPMRCETVAGGHHFVVEQNAQTPLPAADEKSIRDRLQDQLDLVVAKFLEVHK